MECKVSEREEKKSCVMEASCSLMHFVCLSLSFFLCFTLAPAVYVLFALVVRNVLTSC